jgi:hypothetical protein
MTEAQARAVHKEILLQLWGTWYTWGGDDPGSVDCSGMTNELAQSVGLTPRSSDFTADGQFVRFQKGRIGSLERQPMDWVFWLNDAGKATHVAVVWDPVDCYIGAEGGGSRVRTVEDAQRVNAFIKIRTLDSRPGPKVFINPWRA